MGESLKPESFKIFKTDSLEKTEERVHNLKDSCRVWRPRGEKEESAQAKRCKHFSVGLTGPSIDKRANSLGWKISSIWTERQTAIERMVSKLFAAHPIFSAHAADAMKFLELIVLKLSKCHPG